MVEQRTVPTRNKIYGCLKRNGLASETDRAEESHKSTADRSTRFGKSTAYRKTNEERTDPQASAKALGSAKISTVCRLGKESLRVLGCSGMLAPVGGTTAASSQRRLLSSRIHFPGCTKSPPLAHLS